MKYRPSILNNLAACPCFESKEGESEAAKEGTLLHLAMETGDLTGLDDEQVEQIKKCQQQEKIYLDGADEVHRELPLEIDLGDEN